MKYYSRFSKFNFWITESLCYISRLHLPRIHKNALKISWVASFINSVNMGILFLQLSNTLLKIRLIVPFLLTIGVQNTPFVNWKSLHKYNKIQFLSSPLLDTFLYIVIWANSVAFHPLEGSNITFSQCCHYRERWFLPVRPAMFSNVMDKLVI